MTLCPSEMKTCQNCRLLNSFGSAQKSSENLWAFSAMFGSLRKIIGDLCNCLDVLANPGHDYLTHLTEKKLTGIWLIDLSSS